MLVLFQSIMLVKEIILMLENHFSILTLRVRKLKVQAHQKNKKQKRSPNKKNPNKNQKSSRNKVRNSLKKSLILNQSQSHQAPKNLKNLHQQVLQLLRENKPDNLYLDLDKELLKDLKNLKITMLY